MGVTNVNNVDKVNIRVAIPVIGETLEDHFIVVGIAVRKRRCLPRNKLERTGSRNRRGASACDTHARVRGSVPAINRAPSRRARVLRNRGRGSAVDESKRGEHAERADCWASEASGELG